MDAASSRIGCNAHALISAEAVAVAISEAEVLAEGSCGVCVVAVLDSG